MRLGNLGLPRDWSPERGLDAQQAETVRKMLLAVVGDPRLVLARLAEALVRLRHARDLRAPSASGWRAEARAIFAPLANRLGVWQLKWELEDLAFRYLEPEEYQRLAARAQREARGPRALHRGAVRASCARSCSAAGVDAQVYGRPKHIYSIYRKMQRKHLPSSRSSTCARCASWWTRSPTATPRSASCTAAGTTFPASSTTTSRPRRTTTTAPSTPP